jgi:AraC-like DNA-binding protein
MQASRRYRHHLASLDRGVRRSLLSDAWRRAPWRQVRLHVERSLSRERVSLTEAARVAGLEKSYFSARFHDVLGVTFLRWQNALRVARALELLADTELSIFEVVDATGFCDARTLQRNFKRMVGVSPCTFRELRRMGGAEPKFSARQERRAPASPLRKVDLSAEKPLR